MKQVPVVFTFMLDAWNERDPERIRSHADKCMAENIVFADPTNFVHGLDAFTEMIRHYRKKYPESDVSRTSGLDSHNNRYRYSWEIHIGGTLLIKGYDFVQLNEQGKIERVDGFFGELPPMEK
jgi:hypothetical protein